MWATYLADFFTSAASRRPRVNSARITGHTCPPWSSIQRREQWSSSQQISGSPRPGSAEAQERAEGIVGVDMFVLPETVDNATTSPRAPPSSARLDVPHRDWPTADIRDPETQQRIGEGRVVFQLKVAPKAPPLLPLVPAIP